MSCNITNNLLSFPAFSALFAFSFCVGATNACIPGSLTRISHEAGRRGR